MRILDASNGKLLGDVDLGGYVGASAAVRDGKAYMGTFENQVMAVDLDAKKIVWTYENPERKFPYLSSAAVTDDLVVIGGRDKTVHGIGRADGAARWTWKSRGRVDASPLVAGGRVVIGTTDGKIVTLNLKDGSEAWSFDTGSGIVGTPALADGRLLVGTTDGQLYCFAGKAKGA